MSPRSIVRDDMQTVIRVLQGARASLSPREIARLIDVTPKKISLLLAVARRLGLVARGRGARYRVVRPPREIELVPVGRCATFVDSVPGPDEVLMLHELRRAIDSVLATLTPREAKIIREYFGLEGEHHDGHTFDEIGRRLGVSHTRIQQIEAKALRKLRHPSRARKLAPYDDRAWKQKLDALWAEKLEHAAVVEREANRAAQREADRAERARRADARRASQEAALREWEQRLDGLCRLLGDEIETHDHKWCNYRRRAIAAMLDRVEFEDTTEVDSDRDLCAYLVGYHPQALAAWKRDVTSEGSRFTFTRGTATDGSYLVYARSRGPDRLTWYLFDMLDGTGVRWIGYTGDLGERPAKKSVAQLDREIAEVIGRLRQAGRR